jgi:hypothetical protein
VAINTGSRYGKVGTFTGTDSNGTQREGLELRPIPSRPARFFYTPLETDRLDLLAFRYYHDPLKFWKICDASDHLDPFDVVVPGKVLPIPPDK